MTYREHVVSLESYMWPAIQLTVLSGRDQVHQALAPLKPQPNALDIIIPRAGVRKPL